MATQLGEIQEMLNRDFPGLRVERVPARTGFHGIIYLLRGDAIKLAYNHTDSTNRRTAYAVETTLASSLDAWRDAVRVALDVAAAKHRAAELVADHETGGHPEAVEGCGDCDLDAQRQRAADFLRTYPAQYFLEKMADAREALKYAIRSLEEIERRYVDDPLRERFGGPAAINAAGEVMSGLSQVPGRWRLDVIMTAAIQAEALASEWKGQAE